MIDPSPVQPETVLQKRRLDRTIHRTSNPSCPACIAGRIHQDAEWDKYHPHNRTGIQADVAPLKKQ